jgi:hypothetical protein
MTVDTAFLVDNSKDIPASYLAQFARLVLQTILKELADAYTLSPKERYWLAQEVRTLRGQIRTIAANKDAHQRESALRAVVSALSINYYHPGGPQILRAIKKGFEDKRMHAPHEGRSRPDITEAILRRAEEAWVADPKSINHPYKTAEIIFKTVMEDLAGLPESKAFSFKPGKPPKKEEERLIGLIGGRISSSKKHLPGKTVISE